MDGLTVCVWVNTTRKQHCESLSIFGAHPVIEKHVNAGVDGVKDPHNGTGRPVTVNKQVVEPELFNKRRNKGNNCSRHVADWLS
jgi:hypothetical protein